MYFDILDQSQCFGYDYDYERHFDLSLQVSPLCHETETPTSPLTTKKSLQAQRIPSTRPRTANQEPAHTERTEG